MFDKADNTLTSNDIAYDLNHASAHDVVFNKKILTKLTSENKIKENDAELEKTDSGLQNCYESVMKYLQDEDELKDLRIKLTEKKEKLLWLKEELEKSLVLLQEDDKALEK